MKLENLLDKLNVVDVWDCHGILKNASWGLGYGCKPDVSKLGFKWVNIGYFTIPLPKNYPKLTAKKKEQVEQVLFTAIQRNGGINMSGWYDFLSIDRERLLKALEGKLKLANINSLVKRVMLLLKQNPMHAFLTYSSRWRCFSGCQGFHERTYVLWNGKDWLRFSVGCHHASICDMFNIEPQKITKKQAEKEVRYGIEHDFRREPIFKGEEESYIMWIDEWLNENRKIGLCEKHGYYWQIERCLECETY